MNPQQFQILHNRYHAILKPQNKCEICGKSRNLKVHVNCSKEKQKIYGEKK